MLKKIRHYSMISLYLGFCAVILLACEDVWGKPAGYYNMCHVEPMFVRVIKDGQVFYYAGTSRTSWIVGNAADIASNDRALAVADVVFADVYYTDDPLIVDVECK